jgi:cell division protein FtsW
MMARIDYPLLMCWLLIMALGAVMVASAGVALDAGLLPRHGVYVLLALLAFALVVIVPLALWQSAHRLAWLLAVLLCVLVLIPGLGVEVNGARRWIELGGFRLQPAEPAKFLLLIYLAGYLTRFSAMLADDPLALFKPLAMVAVVAALLLAQPDFGTGVVLTLTACGALFIAGARLRHFLSLLLVAGAGLILLAYQQPYRLSRLVTFWNPWAYATDGGYQLTQALIAFGRGETFGLGLGEGIQKLDYLPEAHNDFIYAVIAEELGLLGAIGVIVLFVFLVLRLLRLARLLLADGRRFPGFLVYGIALLLGIQYLVNLGVNTGVLPTKGLTLPFVSYGGNSLIVCCALLGLVCRAGFEIERGAGPPPKRGKRRKAAR